MRSEFQAILDQNDIEERMKQVAVLIKHEVQLKTESLAKFEAQKKRFRDR